MNNERKIINSSLNNLLISYRNAIVICFYVLFLVSCVTTEIVTVKNEVSNETIYLKYWSLHNPISAISSHRFTNADATCDVIVDNEGCFFYKYNKDTLYIHTYGIDSTLFENVKRKFKTKLVYQEMKSGNADYCEFCTFYKKLGYKFFPTSMLYTIDNEQ